MQAWGVQSRFGVRDTGREPSKSGVVGLLAAALGRPRHAPIADLAALRMGVRVDREGTLLRDFHTAGKDGYFKAKGDVERRTVILSHRYYLADACFLVGLEGDTSLLETLFAALRDPQWSLFLGRRAFVPGKPIWLKDGLRAGALEAELHPSATPWLKGQPRTYPLVRMVIEDRAGSEVRTDQPLSFHPRRFAPRRVINEYRNLEVSL